jgi:MFS family permease
MKSRVYSKDPAVARALRYSVRDGVAYSIMSGAGEIYFSAYALFLKASTTQIAFLAAFPPLLGSLAQLLAAWLERRLGRRKAIIVAGVFGQLLVWLPMIWLPYVFPEYAVVILILCVVWFYASGNLASPAWSSLMGDLVPARKRGRFFGQRTRYMSLTAFFALVVAGGVLHFWELRDQTRVGFLIIFSVAALARAYSLLQITRMIEPPYRPPPATRLFVPGWWRRPPSSDFARFLWFFGLMNFAAVIAAPFFTVYMLRDLQFSYLQFTAAIATSVLAQFLTLALWGRLCDVFGNRRVLAVTGALIPVLPALWLVSTEFWYIVAIQMIGGVSWAGFSLGTSNFIYDLAPAERRAQYMAVHGVGANLGIFAGALLGGYLSRVLPDALVLAGGTIEWPSNLCWVFLVSSLLRAAVALAFIPRLRELRVVRPISVGQLVFRVTGFHALAGLLFDLMGPGRRARRATRAAAKRSARAGG